MIILKDVSSPFLCTSDFDKVMNYKVSSQNDLPYTPFWKGLSKLFL